MGDDFSRLRCPKSLINVIKILTIKIIKLWDFSKKCRKVELSRVLKIELKAT